MKSDNGLTYEERAQLSALGYTYNQITSMTPKYAHEKLAGFTHNQPRIEPILKHGDTVKITTPRGTRTGKVVSASGTPDWKDQPNYIYDIQLDNGCNWKQDLDGGTVEVISRVEE